MVSPRPSLPPRRYPLAALRDYVVQGHNDVAGWLLPGAAMVIWSLIEIQEKLGIRGDIAEIGVYRGKLFILLCQALREDETGTAIDPFEYPTLGKFQADFERNLTRAGIDPSVVRILSKLSQDVDAPMILQDRAHQVRLFSIDGEHEREPVLRDLALAEQCLAPDGVMIIDDLFHTWSPGATEGVIKYLDSHGGDIVPLALLDRQADLRKGGVKLLACRKHKWQQYAWYLRELHPRNLKMVTQFCGHHTLVFNFFEGAWKKRLFDY